MKFWLVTWRQTLCLRGKSKVISVPKARSICSEAAETKPMNRPPFDTITAKRTVCLSVLSTEDVSKRSKVFVKICIFAKLLYGTSVATFGVKQ